MTLKRNFQSIDPRRSRIILLEGGPRILPSFDAGLAAAAHGQLTRQGVEVRTGAIAEVVDGEGVIVAGERIAAATVLWTAGVAASPLAAMSGAKVDGAGRALVGPRLETKDGSRIFVIGDAAGVIQGGKPVPGVAQTALQQGTYVGRLIRSRVELRPPPPPFRYRDKGSMAVVGKDFAVLQAPGFKLSGRVAWLAWAFLHIATLPRLQNRLRVSVQWLWSYFTGQRSSRLIAERTSAEILAAEALARPP